MQITEVRIKLVDGKNTRNRKIKAFGSIDFDYCFAVHGLKIIEEVDGLFVAMPDWELTDHCYNCHRKTRLRDRYCAFCAAHLDEDRVFRKDNGRVKLFTDIAHPINQECREMIEGAVLKEYYAELERAKHSGYRCRYHEFKDSNV